MQKTIELNSADLLAVLKKVKPTIPKSAVLSILESVLISSDGKNDLSITASNIETFITCSLKCKSHNELLFAMPFGPMFDIVSLLPLEQMKICYDEVNMKATIECDGASYEINCDEPVGNFPAIPEMGEQLTSRFMTKRMVDDCTKALLFVSKDSLRPAMTGVYFDFRQKKLKIVSTDGHSLFFSDTYDTVFDSRSFIVPELGMKIICGIAKKEYGQISFCDTHCIYSSDYTQIITRLVDAKFPEYDAIIPEYKSYVTVNRQSLIQAIKCMSAVTNNVTKEVVFEVDEKMTIEGNDIDFGNKGFKSLPISNPFGLSCDFGFNAKIILNVLSSSKFHSVNIYTDGDAGKAFIFKDGDEKETLLCMPLMLHKDAA